MLIFFRGIDGIGKLKIANWFAKSIMCDSPVDGYYCENCAPCKTFLNNADFLQIDSIDGMIKVDAVRSMIEEIVIKPTTSNRKVVIINDAHLMNENAQNALLKVLEEPPEYATIILVTSNKEKIISTIKSRCTTINFNKLSDDEIKEVLQEQINDEILSISGGSISKYLKLKDSKYLNVLELLEKTVSTKDLLEIYAIMQKIKDEKNIKEYIDEVLDLFIVKVHESTKDNPLIASKRIEIIEKVRNNILRNANLDLQLDYLGLNMWEINKS